MKRITTLLSVVALLFAAIQTQAVIIVSNDNQSLEGVNIEILHNTEKQSGTVIVRQPNCGQCSPLSLSYEGDLDFSINGYPSAFDPQGKTIGKGDISYNPDDMSVGHINLYQ